MPLLISCHEQIRSPCHIEFPGQKLSRRNGQRTSQAPLGKSWEFLFPAPHPPPLLTQLPFNPQRTSRQPLQAYAHATGGESEAGHRGISAEGPMAFCASLSQAGPQLRGQDGGCAVRHRRGAVRARGWGPQQRPEVSRLGGGAFHWPASVPLESILDRPGQDDAPATAAGL